MFPPAVAGKPAQMRSEDSALIPFKASFSWRVRRASKQYLRTSAIAKCQHAALSRWFVASLWIDRRYEERRFVRSNLWVIRCPLLYWVLSMQTVALAQWLLRRRDERARWISPDPGLDLSTRKFHAVGARRPRELVTTAATADIFHLRLDQMQVLQI